MRYLSVVRIDESTGRKPSEKLRRDMGKLIEEMSREGVLVRTAGLQPSSRGFRMRLRDGELSLTDAPFTESKEVIAGYAVLEAESRDEAVEFTRRFLQVHGEDWNLECEVRPLEGPEFGRDA